MGRAFRRKREKIAFMIMKDRTSVTNFFKPLCTFLPFVFASTLKRGILCVISMFSLSRPLRSPPPPPPLALALASGTLRGSGRCAQGSWASRRRWRRGRRGRTRRSPRRSRTSTGSWTWPSPWSPWQRTSPPRSG